MALQHLRSSTASKRADPAAMADGQLAINTNAASTGLFFKDSGGNLIKVGPVHVGTTAPNATPASGGHAGNSIGEQWLDTTGGGYVLKIWDGSAWQSEAGEFVNASGDTMTGALVMDNQQQIRFRETTANGTNFVALQAPASVASDKTITLPDVTGTVVTTGDTGSVTSTMLLDGTILNADVNASAAIAGTKISPDFGSQTVTTTGVISSALGAAATPSITFTGDLNTGIYSPGADQVAISTNGSERIRILSDGKLGLGTSSVSHALDVHGADGVTTRIKSTSGNSGNYAQLILESFNSFSGSGQAYIRGISSATGNSNTDLVFGTNPSGFGAPEERVRITAGGAVGIGTTNPVLPLQVNGSIFGYTEASSTSRFLLRNSTTGSSEGGFDVNQVGVNTTLFNSSNGYLSFGTNNTERGRWDSSGRLLVGTSSARDNLFKASASAGFQIEGTSGNAIPRRSVFAYNENGIGSHELIFVKSRGTTAGSNTVVNSGDNIGLIAFNATDGAGDVSAAFITAQVDGTPGTNDMPGRLVFSTTADGASSPTERMRIRSDGNVLIGTTTVNAGIGNTTTGATLGAEGYLAVSRSVSTPLYVNRSSDDGTLVDLRQDGNTEGTISVSGTTVSYNGAHLSRWSQLPGGAERTKILRGSVLSNIDEMCEWGEEDNEQLNRMKISDVEGDPNVSGVFQSWDDDDDTYTNDFYCAMTGDFIIRIAEGTVVQRGDLLMSAGDGTAKPQGDGFVQDKTIAKVTSTHVTCTYDDGSYCVPCVLMAC